MNAKRDMVQANGMNAVQPKWVCTGVTDKEIRFEIRLGWFVDFERGAFHLQSILQRGVLFVHTNILGLQLSHILNERHWLLVSSILRDGKKRHFFRDGFFSPRCLGPSSTDKEIRFAKPLIFQCFWFLRDRCTAPGSFLRDVAKGHTSRASILRFAKNAPAHHPSLQP